MVDKNDARALLDKSFVGDDVGIYVFSLKTGRGTTPWYVGKTTRSFISEALTDGKLLKYNQIVSGRKGTPYFYFLSLQRGRGKINERAIDELESLMIGMALKKNDDLLNLSKTKQYELVVQGVVNSSAGKPTQNALQFREMIGLSKRVGLH